MSYLKSNRKKLKDYVCNLRYELNLSITRMSMDIGKGKNYLCVAISESTYVNGGDMSYENLRKIKKLLDDKYIKVSNAKVIVKKELTKPIVKVDVSFEDKIILEAARIILSRKK